jgi:predicted DNA-binding ribbon-helix-helix protein
MKSIQLPDDVYQRAAALAEADNVSVDRLIATIVNERANDWSRMQARAARGSVDKLRSILARAGNSSPEAVDSF